MKKTLLFSNVVGDGDICAYKNGGLRFNKYMEEYLQKNIDNNFDFVFINAPGLGGEENYLNNILMCFKNIGITFKNILDIENDSEINKIEKFIKENNKTVYFLMGGNPLTQIEIIDKFKLRNKIRDYDGLVIGFCAGAINLSKYSIITTDEDFHKPDSYNGIGRVNLIIEPHYNSTSDEKRNNELLNFAEQYNEKIYGIPDESIIVVEENDIIEYGKIYYFDSNK